ncbi:MAG: rRNA maturation RNase YbeY [Rhodobacteraceae bacterium]|nr:rRNA maturation RNase YbeY [Paracoccaceae bacterium]
MKIDLLIEDSAWDEPRLGRLAKAAGAVALAELGLNPAQFGISLLACDDARIAALNDAFRGQPAPTNVLAWPAGVRTAAAPGKLPHLPPPRSTGPPLELGDIAIAHGVVTREAKERCLDLDDHLTHLIIHGLLHLLGFDHMTDPDAALMEGLETRILAGLGVADPY